MAQETLDELSGYDLRLIQPVEGYRFSLDPLLLADFAGGDEAGRVIDLGTGSGIIPLVMARKLGSATIIGVEVQEEAAELARRNMEMNGLSERIEILCADILSLRNRFPVSTFDLVVANPPYRRQGTGRISPRSGRDRARHESTATMADFMEAAKYLVRPSGTISFIYHPVRLTEFCTAAGALKLSLLRLRMVHGNRCAPARMVLLEIAKGRKGDLEVLPPLFVFGEEGGYSAEMERILSGRI
ncbi:MAG TPA: tRNA1(Val) (adenine(37)-N6)-methyltransferase [Geobacteraceae bacterium]|nr:tRNA1(Val) (adenine(37)-N6)-methyltransferase [Geobacteraceae bacterium]